VISAAVTRAVVRSTLLDVLEPDVREAVVPRLRRREYKRGQVVFNDGDLGDCLHLLQSGRVVIQLVTMTGQTIILRVVHPGEFFGELALVHPDGRRLGRVCALEPSQTLVLHRKDFEELRSMCPTMDRLLVSALAEHVATISRLAVELIGPPEFRVWRRLAALAEAYGDEPIRMSQDELACAAGTVRQTASRVLHDGVRQGILTVERCEITVLDRVAVNAMASADPTWRV
jgi:CRP/FNR family transcriptional regulator, cyclic AMP receptor protein